LIFEDCRIYVDNYRIELGYLVSFNHAAYTIYFLTLLNYLTVLVIDLLTNGFDWSTGGSVREDGSLFFIVEVVIVKRKHGACVQKTEHEEELYEREFMCLCCVLCNKFVQNQCIK
jgi:hypothetical protein